MTILVLGGRGKTSIRLASLLDAAKVPFVLASRSTDPSLAYRQSSFDWLDENTYGNPFELASSSDQGLGAISAVYLVGPPIIDMYPPMKAFIDFARRKGVQRFVLLSASSLEKGGPAMGTVHEYLASLEGVEFAVLRPTWFMENFTESHLHTSIKNEDKIHSATAEGGISFISADDIARVAFSALTDKQPHNTDHLILGSEVLSYDKVADILTSVLSRKITHVKLSQSEFRAHMMANFGMPEDYAAMMAMFDVNIAAGAEDRCNDLVERVTGQRPQTFEEFALKKKGSWV